MTWHCVAQGDLTARAVKAVVGDQRVLLVAHEDHWLAFEDRCSHAGCAFSDDGEIDGLVAVCDCHGSEFDIRTGEVLRPPATEAIRTYPTRVSDDRLEVEL